MALILMIIWGIIMIIDIRSKFEKDIFHENDLIFMNKSKPLEGFFLSAAEWTLPRDEGRNFLKILMHVFNLIRSRLVGYDLWLFVGDEAWQEDNRIVRYRKCFDALRLEGVDFTPITEKFEFSIECDKRVKFFGVVKLNNSLISIVPMTMSPRSCTYIVATKKGCEFKSAILSGWTGQWDGDGALIASLAKQDGFLLRRVGYFDDPDVGLVAVGNASTINRLF
ncbi:hypothetical protein [Burkholderia perseverans]|uniref:hypothetical protein n=1 Tax=Burkholderia perseverans TaxID=2615214 RepID=UPI001FED9675|nr:hypothetical protein [Burkholderia perseverans]